MLTRSLNARMLLLLNVAFLATAHSATAADWPLMGRDATRNAVSPKRGGPSNCKFLEVDLIAAVALDTVSRLGHELQSLRRNVKAATSTLSIRAVPDSH